MPRYRCTIVETCTYSIEVDAENEEDAKVEAEAAFTDADDLNPYFCNVDERSVEWVEEVPEVSTT
jgi:hypothetical protein